MTTTLLSRSQLEIINRKTLRYPLMIAEKDYYLALAMQQIYDSSLREKLIFKGGTALHHCYLKQHRFSEDLDFNLLDRNLAVEQLAQAFESSGIFTVKKVFASDYTLKIERLQYAGLLGQPGNIKVEIDVAQNTILPLKKLVYHNVWGVKTFAKVFDQREICAEKIRATSQRARYRDFYDLYLLIKQFSFSLVETINLVKQKEVRTPISITRIQQNWQIAKAQQASDLERIYCTNKIVNQQIEKMIDSLDFADINFSL